SSVAVRQLHALLGNFEWQGTADCFQRALPAGLQTFLRTEQRIEYERTSELKLTKRFVPVSFGTGPAPTAAKNKTFLRRFYVHDSSGIADFDVAGSTAHLALQPGLGILPERGIRARSRGGSGTASRRSFINPAVYNRGL